MDSRPLGDGEVNACPDGHGVFLRRADLGSLVEAEQDWHRHAGQHTMPMPRITADMDRPADPQATGEGLGRDAFRLGRVP